jgi:hypothetical protein
MGSDASTSAESLHTSISRVSHLIARHKANDTERTQLVSGAHSVAEAAARAKRELDALEHEASEMEKYVFLFCFCFVFVLFLFFLRF